MATDDFLNTDNVQVAMIAAALSLSAHAKDGSGSRYFGDHLERFLTAYKAILQAVHTGNRNPDQIDVESLVGKRTS